MNRARLAALGALLCSSCVGVVAPVEEDYPPPAYIATATPVYREGRPAYWYGGRWYARDGARWHAYREEPVYLREHRAHVAVPARPLYGRGHVVGGRPAVVHQAAPVVPHHRR